MRASVALGITGFSLIAVTYGMARFSWGLMLPAVASDIPFSSRLAGVISACSFAAYCLAIIAASLLTARYGARLPAALAALCAAGGLLLLALAFSPAMLAAGLFIAGLSSGLASPALAAAVNRMIAAQQQPQVNTMINAGTAAGIILSVPLLQWLPGGWRVACIVFSIMALACLLPVLRYLPGKHPDSRDGKINWRKTLLCRSLARLAIVAFISGLASAAWWSFGPELLQHHSAVDKKTTSLLWLVSGGAGIVGALTGPVAARIGLHQVWRLSQLFMALPLLLLAHSESFTWGLFPAVALCGAGYVTVSGVLLVCGAAATAHSPASGVGVLFFMLAAGQVVGSVIFGMLYAAAGAATALTLFALLSALMMIFVPQGIHGK
ncbi:MFS transporter [Erwiniaceae bacterium BAC15a-03b]|uniref:MFS transporter n=1 Tax=Winslowiella arboricola TaxID=2978220 RepID=A0A9J6PL82_9GAMM|nr:MFS transporter [Winslowiella arboricola]MCU5772559.1 MFS transporter [Winslowiella arboricola]MCU5779081.1 MFS transporter [Winslowiella arboricola]